MTGGSRGHRDARSQTPDLMPGPLCGTSSRNPHPLESWVSSLIFLATPPPVHPWDVVFPLPTYLLSPSPSLLPAVPSSQVGSATVLRAPSCCDAPASGSGQTPSLCAPPFSLLLRLSPSHRGLSSLPCLGAPEAGQDCLFPSVRHLGKPGSSLKSVVSQLSPAPQPSQQHHEGPTQELRKKPWCSSQQP